MTTTISKSTTPAAVKASGSPAKKKQRNNAAKKSSVATASPQPVFPANRDSVSMDHNNPVFMAAAAAAAANDLAMVFPFSGMNTSSTEQQSSAFSAKPKEVSAGPPRHENTTLLPIASSQMATGSPAPPPPTAGPIAWHLLLSYYYQQQLLLPPLVKDDVFLAAPSVINDNESVITTNSSNDDGSSSSSNSSSAAAPNSTVGWAPTPCLSPVTSPSDFLCNHEPLFDGIEDLQQQQQQHKHTHNSNYFDDNDDTQITSNITNDDHPASETSDSPATPPPLFDWYDFKDDNDNAAHMPTPSPTASDHESCSLFGDVDEPLDFDDEISSICSDEDVTRRRELSFDDDEEEEDDEDDEDGYALPSSGTSLKRKRSMLSSDEEDDDDDEDEGDQGIMEHVEEDQEGLAKDNIPVLQRLHRLRLSPPVVSKPTTTATRKTPVNQQRKQKPKPAAKRRTKRHSGRRGARPKAIPAAAVYDDLEDEQDGVHRTIFERLTHAGIDWCRYCGTTEGVNWRPGPWGKRTLCK